MEEVAQSAAPAQPQPVDNRIFILILQHPQEAGEPLATAALTRALLQRARLVTGLSWPNLGQILGRRSDAKRWGALYLGSARPAALAGERELIVLDRRGEPAPEQEAVLRGLEGVVLLDGTWSQAKTLWWRNPWLLKLHRLVLNPRGASRYGRIRREPRREALSSLEAAALVLKHLDGRRHIDKALLDALDRLIAAARPARRRRPRRP